MKRQMKPRFTEIVRMARNLSQRVSRFQLAQLMQEAERGRGELSRLTRFERGELERLYERERQNGK